MNVTLSLIIAGIVAVIMIAFVVAACRVAGDADDRAGISRG